MASKLIGRTACPECGFGAAHVKESERCVYRYCPECGSQYNTRGERQRALLLEKTRGTPTATPTATAGSDTAPTAAPAAGKPAATTTTQQAPANRRSALFGL
jgi:Zn-finger nucleic acid-binding protein